MSKLFNKETGLVASFLYAVLIVTINSDRWVVPTVTTSIWSIWYFYCVVMLTRRKFSILPLLGILLGLIWNIHIALLPCLIALPVSLIIAKKLPSIKQLFLFLSTLIITSLPLIFFELRHNFQQSFALMINFTSPHAGPTGYEKFMLVLSMVTQNINALFFTPQSFKLTQNPIFILLILLSVLLVIHKNNSSIKELLPIYSWFLGVILFFSISSSPISEYYFSNLQVIFISFISLLLAFLTKRNHIFLCLISGILIFIGLKNIYFFITQDIYHKGYLEKKAIVDMIKKDILAKNYPCFGITYITTPGEDVGFRYLFYLNNLRLTHPSSGVPVYNIVIPDELSAKEVEIKFGHIGIILPKNDFSKDSLEKVCSLPNTNLTDPVFGFVK